MHSCDNRRCVNPAHLSLGTKADNSADMTRKARSAWGERATSAKLSESQVRDIFMDARTQTAIAKAYGVSQSRISAIKHGHSWRQLNLAGTV